WLWLNGIAMQRMVEQGQIEPAWRLFRATSQLALTRGTVGGLPETMDAFPHPGEVLPRLTGTFLQAWSNAEQLRVWYQCFLGVRPDMLRGRVLLAPRLPAEVKRVELTMRVGAGSLRAAYDTAQGGRRFLFRLTGQPASLVLDVAPYATRAFAASAGDALLAEIRSDGLHARLESAAGAVRESVVLPLSAERQREQAALDAILDGTRFAQPDGAETHPAMKQVYRREP
ncbi:MAG TPA: hypothetical protein VF832_05920, partial [Longimicrobiales bacterium]